MQNICNVHNRDEGGHHAVSILYLCDFIWLFSVLLHLFLLHKPHINIMNILIIAKWVAFSLSLSRVYVAEESSEEPKQKGANIETDAQAKYELCAQRASRKVKKRRKKQKVKECINELMWIGFRIWFRLFGIFHRGLMVCVCFISHIHVCSSSFLPIIYICLTNEIWIGMSEMCYKWPCQRNRVQ